MRFGSPFPTRNISRRYNGPINSKSWYTSRYAESSNHSVLVRCAKTGKVFCLLGLDDPTRNLTECLKSNQIDRDPRLYWALSLLRCVLGILLVFDTTVLASWLKA